MLYLSSRLDEVKGQLSEHDSGERKALGELDKVRSELGVRETQVKSMEAELQKKWKSIEEARTREDKLVQRLQHVST